MRVAAFHITTPDRSNYIVAELKGEASNHDVLSFRVGMYVCMYVCMYICRLYNAILCLCMYICSLCNTILCSCFYVWLSRLHNYCAIKWPKCAPRDDYGPRLLPGLCGLYFMEEHNHMYKRFKSVPCSLRIVYDFCDTLKTHLIVCRVCCPLNGQYR